MSQLVQDLMRLWGYSESQAVELINRYELSGEMENLTEIVSLKESIVDGCSFSE